MPIDDKVLARLLRGEVHRINQGVVADPLPLGQLRAMDEPRAATQGGGWHVFDKAALDAFAAPLSPLVRSTVRLPLRFHVSHEAGGDCFLADAAAIEALQEHGATRSTARDGKLWMAHPLALQLARRWPTLVQFVRQ